MTEPLHIRVERPYQSKEEFLDAEAWSVAARSMLLIGVGPVSAGTALRCELLLGNGQTLVVAEGTAVKYADATATRPAGLVVRYKRLSAGSSEFVKQAVARAAETRAVSSPAAAEGPLSSRASNPAPRPSSRAPARHSERASDPRRSVQQRGKSGRPEAPSRRSSRPAGRASTPPGPDTPSVRTPQSKSPGRTTGAAGTRYVSDVTSHDSDAMQRLRTRRVSRAISSPPDRDAVLARLKKK